MPDLRTWFSLSFVVLSCSAGECAEEALPTPPHPTPLTSQETAAAISLDGLTIPTPGEFFAAIDKGGKPKWSSQYRPPTVMDSADRAQMALNLGTLIADGYIAVEAEDGQQVKNIGRDVLAVAKKLSVADSVLARGKSITQFAESGAWSQLNEELEATQNEVKKALDENRDTDLITLVSIGGWVRGTQVVSGLILENYNADNARLLRQSAVVAYLRTKLDKLPSKIRDNKLVGQVSSELEGIEKLVSFTPDHVPSSDEVKKLNVAATRLTKEISNVE